MDGDRSAGGLPAGCALKECVPKHPVAVTGQMPTQGKESRARRIHQTIRRARATKPWGGRWPVPPGCDRTGRLPRQDSSAYLLLDMPRRPSSHSTPSCRNAAHAEFPDALFTCSEWSWGKQMIYDSWSSFSRPRGAADPPDFRVSTLGSQSALPRYRGSAIMPDAYYRS